MSGHNKWSQIKNKKAAKDAVKSKIFTKHVKNIQMEARRSKGDMNDPGLKAAIEAAKRDNMPKDNIERAISKGSGADADQLERIVYEAYGPGGVAMIIVAVTDNRNRAAQEVRFILSKQGFEIANPGAASWAFTSNGNEWTPNSTVDLSQEDEEKLEKLLEALDESDEVQEVYTNAA
jgi:YebC/PmpR family DNA-binding regulatory protein